MSVKQERPEAASCPPPPPLLHQGVRMNPPMYAQFPYAVANLPPGALVPRPPILQPSPGSVLPAPESNKPTSAPSEPAMSEDEINKRIDKASIKGTFGWETIDNTNIPCIFRNSEKYVSVRMVEQKLLSKYPSTYPDELRHRPPLMSQFITRPESRLLNEINIEHCACEYGQRSFTEKDLVVSLKDFVAFYRIVKKHFPNELRSQERQAPPPTLDSTGGGWVQVNNTVVPYIRRHAPATKEILNLAPLPVIKYAAGLLTETSVPSLEPTDDECKLLSDMCKSAGLDFNFSRNTPLILLQQLPVYCTTKILIKRLPDDDPFGNAEYCPEFDLEDTKDPPSQRGVILPTMQDLSPQGYANRLPPNSTYMTGPPNVTVQPGSSIPFANMQPQTGTHSLQALEKIAGPPRKKQRVTGSPAEMGPKASTPNSTPRASPSQVNASQKSPVGGMVPPMSFPQAMPGLRPGNMQFVNRGQTPQLMAPPGAIPGHPNMWIPSQANPADMQKLAEMMNMQAAILSGPLGNPQNAPMFQPQPQAILPKPQGGQVPASAASSTVTSASQATQDRSKTPASKPKQDGVVEKIQPMEFHGKKISCLVKGSQNDKYALIEAISRVYFSHCSLDEFVNAMTSVLQIPIYQLDRDEEKAFISFYGLPTSSLKCNKVLKLTDLDKLMPQLKYMFKAKDATGVEQPGSKQSPPSSLNNKSSVNGSQDTNNNGSAGGAPTTLPPANPFTGSKKPAGTGNASAPSKLGKLEDAVNRLRQNKLMQMESSSTNQAVSPKNGANELGQGQVPRNPFPPQPSIPPSALPK